MLPLLLEMKMRSFPTTPMLPQLGQESYFLTFCRGCTNAIHGFSGVWFGGSNCVAVVDNELLFACFVRWGSGDTN
jgi:hypothetical protein